MDWGSVFCPPPAEHDFHEDRTCVVAEHVHVMPFFQELFVFFNCFSLTLEVTVPDDSDDEFAYEEVRFFLFGYTF